MDQSPPVKPLKVQQAVKLLYLALVIGFLRGCLEVAQFEHRAPLMLVLILMLCSYGLIWFLTHKINHGRNWARITLFLFFSFVTANSLWLYMATEINNLLPALLGIVQLIVQSVAIVFLFYRESSDWFKAIKTMTSLKQ